MTGPGAGQSVLSGTFGPISEPFRSARASPAVGVVYIRIYQGSSGSAVQADHRILSREQNISERPLRMRTRDSRGPPADAGKKVPLCNLSLTMAQRFGVETERFNRSSSTFDALG